MKWIKYFIIIVVIIIIIIIALLINRKEEEEIIVDYGEVELTLEKMDTKVKIDNSNTYFSAEACVDKIYAYLSTNNKQGLYGILNQEYIKNNNVTVENVLNVIKLNNIKKHKTTQVYKAEKKDFRTFFVQVITEGGYTYLNINEDTNTMSFDFVVINKDAYTQYLNNEISIEEKTITRNSYNSIPYKNISSYEITEEYFKDFIEYAIDFPEEAFNRLDNAYRKAKFSDINEFKKYITSKTELRKIYDVQFADWLDYDSYEDYEEATDNIGIKNYKKENYDNYTKYVFLDTFNNYYIFHVNSMMQYTVILDTYTIDLPEFLEKYNSTTEQGKVALNLNKFALALNDGDYKYAYSKLADGFKANNFPTLSSFETYVKSNLFTKNKFNYKKFGKEGETYYTYTVDITNDSGALSNAISKTFIMQLGEGTDFKLSFNK